MAFLRPYRLSLGALTNLAFSGEIASSEWNPNLNLTTDVSLSFRDVRRLQGDLAKANDADAAEDLVSSLKLQLTSITSGWRLVY